MGKRPVVTLFVDASFCPEIKGAGWGAWVRDDVNSGKTYGDEIGVMEGDYACSGYAELIAVAQAIKKGYNLGYIPQGCLLVIRTDCLQVVQLFEGDYRKPKQKWLEVYRAVSKALKARDIVIRMDHVGGHGKDGCRKRSWVNKQCDKIAKQNMRSVRNKYYFSD